MVWQLSHRADPRTRVLAVVTSALVRAVRRQEARDLALFLYQLDPDTWATTGEERRVSIVSHWLALRWAVGHGRLRP